MVQGNVDAADPVSVGNSATTPVNTITINAGSMNQGDNGPVSEGETGDNTGTGDGNKTEDGSGTGSGDRTGDGSKTGSGSGTGGGADAVSLNFFVFALTVFRAHFIQFIEN